MVTASDGAVVALKRIELVIAIEHRADAGGALWSVQKKAALSVSDDGRSIFGLAIVGFVRANRTR